MKITYYLHHSFDTKVVHANISLFYIFIFLFFVSLIKKEYLALNSIYICIILISA